MSLKVFRNGFYQLFTCILLNRKKKCGIDIHGSTRVKEYITQKQIQKKKVTIDDCPALTNIRQLDALKSSHSHRGWPKQSQEHNTMYACFISVSIVNLHFMKTYQVQHATVRLMINIKASSKCTCLANSCTYDIWNTLLFHHSTCQLFNTAIWPLKTERDNSINIYHLSIKKNEKININNLWN